MPNSAFRSFSSGEIAPSLYARTDLAKYQSSVRTMRNFIAQRHGGATMRAGLEYVASAKNAALPSRLLPFISSDVSRDIYILEFGDGYLRFHRGGAPVLATNISPWVVATPYGAGNIVSQGGVNYYCILGHTSAAGNKPPTGASYQTFWYALSGAILEIPTPYAVGDLPELQWVQEGEAVTLTHPTYPTQDLIRLTPNDPEQWILQQVVFGPSIPAPTSLALANGNAGVIIYYAVTAVNDVTGEESLAAVVSATNRIPSAGTPTVVSWHVVFGVTKYNIYRSTDGITFGYIGSASALALTPTTKTVWVANTGLVSTSTEGSWQTGTSAEMNVTAGVITDKASDGNYTIKGLFNIDVAPAVGGTPGPTEGRLRVLYSRDAEPQVDAGIVIDITFSGNGHIGPTAFLATINIPDNGYTNLSIFIQPEVLATGNGIDTFVYQCNCDETTGPNNSISWTKSGTNYSDANTAADMTIQPPQPVTYFTTQDNYPACVANFQQRRIYGRSNNERGRIWGSRVASPNNFTSDIPLADVSSFNFEMASKKNMFVKHLIDLGRLVCFTSSEERVIEGEAQVGILKPDSLNVRSYTYHGASSLRPLIVGDTAIYTQARGNQVRLLKFGNDLVNADLTIMAAHLFRGRTLVDWDIALTPDSIIWIVRSDGTLLGLTFLTDQDVWGWHRHDTDGAFENVCVVPEGGEDRVYVVVRRTINGSTVRYIERMAIQAIKGITDLRDYHYMDAGKAGFDGRNTDPTNPIVLSTGGGWTTSDLLTLTATKNTFSGGDVGKTFFFVADNGDAVYIVITTFSSATVIQGYGEVIIPASLQDAAGTANWARCASQVTLPHLVNETVSVLADGQVIGSPNNSQYVPQTLDGGGVLNLSHPFSVIRVGLPITADLETLDIDTPTSTIKNKKRVVSRVVVQLENSADIFVGQPDQPTDDSPLNNLVSLKVRQTEQYTLPPSLVTDDRDITPLSSHNTNGRILIRQVDPLPTTVLMVAPSFAEE